MFWRDLCSAAGKNGNSYQEFSTPYLITNAQANHE
jgi:hypothetical protein